MHVLVSLATKRVVPYARTRFNTIPDDNQELATPRSRLLGACTIRGCGSTRQALETRCLKGSVLLLGWMMR
eukprot:12931884-Prorocentrum_lima.AAC.1